MLQCPDFHMGVGDTILEPHVCTETTLPKKKKKVPCNYRMAELMNSQHFDCLHKTLHKTKLNEASMNQKGTHETPTPN